MPVDPARLKDVFVQALARTDPADRAAYLDAACAGDAALRSRVEALLRASADPDSLLDSAAPAPPRDDAGGTATFAPPADHAPTRTAEPPVGAPGTLVAGRYKLLQQIGEGGMGTVWMADQTEPVKRRVAVKLIRAERGRSATILARFEAERQAIALMDHPHIAKLLDAGTTAEGAPYFVMELVKGVPLTEFCDAHRLSVPDRLALFQRICSAVQHAHQKGVIHRDLKPSNILVESHDGKPVPKVIDFGLAKATTGMQLTENTLFTGFGSVMGTPTYMAPEQATFNAVDVDTRADVYALGVILYELLTGTTPISRETIKKAALDEMLKLIREQEAPTPSSRLSASAAAPTVAANRHTEPAKLGRFVKGELDWIVLKALSKDRDRRYETANGFAADVGRFLAHEPVTAGPPSVRYRLRKFVRRNRPQVIAASLVLLALVAGVVGTTLGLIQAERQRLRAEENEAKAVGAAEDERRAKDAERRARASADAERAKADQARDRALDALDAMTSDLTRGSLTSQQTVSPEQKRFLTEILGVYRGLSRESGTDERWRHRLAKAAARVAYIEITLGRKEQAAAAIRQARDAYAALVAEFPAEVEYPTQLVRCHANIAQLLTESGKLAEAEAEVRAGLAVSDRVVAKFPEFIDGRQTQAYGRKQLADIYVLLGRTREAEVEYRAAVAGLAKVIETIQGEVPNQYRFDLALCRSALTGQLSDAKRFADAEPEARRTITELDELIGDEPDVEQSLQHHQLLANSHLRLATILAARGKPVEAERASADAAAECERLVARFPGSPQSRQELSSIRILRGRFLARLGKPVAAEAESRAGIELLRRLCDDHKDEEQFQKILAIAHCELADLYAASGRPADAVTQLELALPIRTALADRHPEALEYRSDLAATRVNLGIDLRRLSKWEASERELTAGFAIYRELADRHPKIPEYRLGVIGGHGSLGELAEARDRPDEAEEKYRLALDALVALARDYPAVAEYKAREAAALDRLALLLGKRNRFADAEQHFRAAVAIRQDLVDANPSAFGYRDDLCRVRFNLAMALADGGKTAAMVEELQKVLALQKALVRDCRDVPEYRRSLGNTQLQLTQTYRLTGKPQEADAESQACLALFQALTEEFPKSADYRHHLERAHRERGVLLDTYGAPPLAAAAEYKAAVALGRKLVADSPANPVYRRNLAGCLNNLGVALRAAGRLTEAEAELRAAVDVQKALVREFPADPRSRTELAMQRNNLGLVFAGLGWWDDAERESRASLAMYQKLTKDEPKNDGYQVGLGNACVNLGNLIQNRGDAARSLEWYDKSIKLLTPLVAGPPTDGFPDPTRFLRNAHWGRARALRAVGKFAETLPDWDRTVELTPLPGRPEMRMFRAVAQCRAGRTAAGVAEAEELLAMPIWGGGGFYDFACLFGMAAGQDRGKQTAYSDRAMDLLTKAAADGYTAHHHMRQDKDLDPIREREDFKKLIANLEAKFPTPKPELAPPPRAVE